LQKQYDISVKIHNLISRSIETAEESDINLIRSRIIDFDMSIGTMIVFGFKWLIASIPIGIVLAILWWFM
jgi:hypothetical protein